MHNVLRLSLALALLTGPVLGVLAALAAVVLVNWYLVPPYGTFEVASTENVVALVVFPLVAGASAVLMEVGARARARAAADAERARRGREDPGVGGFAGGARAVWRRPGGHGMQAHGHAAPRRLDHLRHAIASSVARAIFKLPAPLLAVRKGAPDFQPPQPPLGASASTERFRAAVRAARIGCDGDIPHVTPEVIIRYATDLEVLGLL